MQFRHYLYRSFPMSTPAQKSKLYFLHIIGQQISNLVDPILAFIVTRFIVCIAAIVGYLMLPTDPGHWNATPGNILLGLSARWDSHWYEWIIKEGYWLRPGQRSNIAFFPMYPLTIKTIMPFVGNNSIFAGVLVSNIAFLFTLIVFYKLVVLEYDDRNTAQRAVTYFAIFPTAFFFSAMYSESLFLFFTITAVYLARKKLWVWAAFMGLLASATRVVGVLTWGIVMWEWLRVHGWTLETIHRRHTWQNLWQGVKQDWMHLIIVAVIPLGLFSYMLFLQMTFKDPFAFSTVQSAWGRENIGPLSVVIRDTAALFTEGVTTQNMSRLLNLSTLIFFIALTPIVWRRLGAGYAIYLLLSLLIPATSATQSIIRYALVCFPVFMILGNWGRYEWFDRMWGMASAMLLGVLTAVFVNWFFVA